MAKANSFAFCGVADEGDDEVAGADIVGEVREELVAEGVVAKILDGGAAVGVGVGFLELGGGKGGVAAEQEGLDGAEPDEVDDLLVGLDRVGMRGGWGKEEADQQEEQRTAKHLVILRRDRCYCPGWRTILRKST